MLNTIRDYIPVFDHSDSAPINSVLSASLTIQPNKCVNVEHIVVGNAFIGISSSTTICGSESVHCVNSHFNGKIKSLRLGAYAHNRDCRTGEHNLRWNYKPPKYHTGLNGIDCHPLDTQLANYATNTQSDCDKGMAHAVLSIINGQNKKIKWGCASEHIH